MYKKTVFDKEQPPSSGWMNVYKKYDLGMIYKSRGECESMGEIVGEPIYRLRIKLKGRDPC